MCQVHYHAKFAVLRFIYFTQFRNFVRSGKWSTTRMKLVIDWFFTYVETGKPLVDLSSILVSYLLHINTFWGIFLKQHFTDTSSSQLYAMIKNEQYGNSFLKKYAETLPSIVVLGTDLREETFLSSNGRTLYYGNPTHTKTRKNFLPTWVVSAKAFVFYVC